MKVPKQLDQLVYMAVLKHTAAHFLAIQLKRKIAKL